MRDLRRINSLLYTTKKLFDDYKLTTYEYQEFRIIIRDYCKNNNLDFNIEDNLIRNKE